MTKKTLTSTIVRGLCGLAVVGTIGMGLVGCGRAGAINFTALRAPVVPPPGGAVTMYKAPLDFEFEGDGTAASASKTGMSQTHFVGIWFIRIAFGDGSLDTAAKAGSIEQINYADYEYLNILGIYQNVKFNAYGE